MIQLYIFRHGETDWNTEERLQGHTDIPLNSKGRAQAETLREKISNLRLELILSSDLSRAKETAEIATQGLNLPFLFSADLRECRMGETEGMLRTDIIQKFGQSAWDRWFSIDESDLDYSFPKGETKRQHIDRVKNALLRELAPVKATRIGVSTHGGTLRRLVHASENAPLEPVKIPNGALYRIDLSISEKRFYFAKDFSTFSK